MDTVGLAGLMIDGLLWSLHAVARKFPVTFRPILVTQMT